MTFWLAVILVGGVILVGMISTLWILARGSNAKRRWTLVGLLLNEEMNAPGESASKSAKERREAKKLLREQQSHLHAKNHAQHSKHHGGSWGTAQHSQHHGTHEGTTQHGSFGVSHHGGGFDSGGGFHGGSGHHG